MSPLVNFTKRMAFFVAVVALLVSITAYPLVPVVLDIKFELVEAKMTAE